MSQQEDLKRYRKLKNEQHEAIKRKHYNYALSMNSKLSYLCKKIENSKQSVEITKWRA